MSFNISAFLFDMCLKYDTKRNDFETMWKLRIDKVSTRLCHIIHCHLANSELLILSAINWVINKFGVGNKTGVSHKIKVINKTGDKSS